MNSLKVCRKSSCPLWTEWSRLTFLPANHKSKPALWMTMGTELCPLSELSASHVREQMHCTDGHWSFFHQQAYEAGFQCVHRAWRTLAFMIWFGWQTGTFKARHIFSIILRQCYVQRYILVKTLRVQAPIWVALSMGHHSHSPWWIEGRQDYISLCCTSLNHLRFIEVVSPLPGCPFTLLICSIALSDWPLPEGIEKRPCPSFIFVFF